MLLDLDTGVKSLGSVVLHHGDGLLHDDGPRVRPCIYEVDRNARHLAAVVEGLSPAMHSRERGQKGRVYVYDAVRKRRKKPLRFA